MSSSSCIISFLYIKPQLSLDNAAPIQSCIISFLYIKPQHVCCHIVLLFVVLYRFSTSNHNDTEGLINSQAVVLYRFSTSNHNVRVRKNKGNALYYIVSLHQTTTLIYAKSAINGCIISFLYIKPQRIR